VHGYVTDTVLHPIVMVTVHALILGNGSKVGQCRRDIRGSAREIGE